MGEGLPLPNEKAIPWVFIRPWDPKTILVLLVCVIDLSLCVNDLVGIPHPTEDLTGDEEVEKLSER
jgi:hypothetical protein